MTQQEQDEELRQTIVRAQAERAAQIERFREVQGEALRIQNRFADTGDRRLGRISTRARRVAEAIEELVDELEGRG